MGTVREVLALGRSNVRGFVLVAVLVSLGTAASLLEPWIYRAIIDDVAGVFVEPVPLAEVESVIEKLGRSHAHLATSGRRMFHAPLQRTNQSAPRRVLAKRTVHQALGTVLIGALLVVLIRALSQALRVKGDNLSARLSNDIERDFIIDTFRHVLRQPLSFFSTRASGAVAHQIDQSDQLAPIVTAVSQDIWPELFALVTVFVILFSVNWELAMVVLLVVPFYVGVTWRMSSPLDTALERYYELWDDVSSRIQQSVGGIKALQAHGTVDYEVGRLRASAGRAYETYLQRNRLQNRYSYMQDVLMAVSKAAVLALGGHKALQHQLTPGDVVLFLAYVDRVYEPIEGLTGLITTLQQHAGSIRRARSSHAPRSSCSTKLRPIWISGPSCR
jgi:ABC-type multidrug transport system fused ATPase/permease subunit